MRKILGWLCRCGISATPGSIPRRGIIAAKPQIGSTSLRLAKFSRALNSRNYRLYFAGQLVSFAGTWMQQIAMSWLVYRLTGSALVLGVMAFASQLPILFLAPLGGVWSDRFEKRRLLIWTQSLSLVQAVALAALVWTDSASPALLVALAFALGCVNALDVPARQSFTVQLVEDRSDLPNAIALNSFLMNAARFVGPALAGFAVVSFGEAVCFLINAFSYLSVIVALRAMRITSGAPARPSSAFQALREGFAYAFGHREIRISLLVVACVSFLATPYAVMMPLFAREIFGGDARTYGLLIASAGGGSLFASLYLASRMKTERLERFVSVAVVIVGAALALFALTERLWFAFPVVMALGFSIILTIAGSNTLIQTRLHDDFRGRVMSIFSMAFLGVAPLGSLVVGGIADSLGVRPVLFACGSLVLLIGIAYVRQQRDAD